MKDKGKTPPKKKFSSLGKTIVLNANVDKEMGRCGRCGFYRTKSGMKTSWSSGLKTHVIGMPVTYGGLTYVHYKG
jgi:hypothetical protein